MPTSDPGRGQQSDVARDGRLYSEYTECSATGRTLLVAKVVMLCGKSIGI